MSSSPLAPALCRSTTRRPAVLSVQGGIFQDGAEEAAEKLEGVLEDVFVSLGGLEDLLLGFEEVGCKVASEVLDTFNFENDANVLPQRVFGAGEA
jgi:hypothetical protein